MLRNEQPLPVDTSGSHSSAVNMRSVVAYTALVALVVFGSLLFIAWRRGRLARMFVAVTVVLVVAWGLALAAIWTDYRDADGFVDCWPSCSHFHRAVASAFWYGPVMFVLLGVFAGVLGIVSARREGRSVARGPR
jgi:hypothetical protein